LRHLEADPYLPRFSVFEQVEIAPNLVLNLPSPEEIAASKMAFADRIVRVKDLQDIDFIREEFPYYSGPDPQKDLRHRFQSE